MEAPVLAELVQRPGPFLTVQLATEASVENASQRNQQRWQARREKLSSSETPDDVLDAVDPLIVDAHLHGETLFVVASGEGLHHASHWPGLPFREFGCWQILAVLGPLLTCASHPTACPGGNRSQWGGHHHRRHRGVSPQRGR